MGFDEWMSSGGYLPLPLRDFHDQKRIFKIVGEIVARQQREDPRNRTMTDLPSWVTAHIYVIDFFLWFMARRGYTLQRSRQPYVFLDLERDIEAFEERERELFNAAMKPLASQGGDGGEGDAKGND